MSEQSYIFGPVPSRRLGLSLGVDIVPFKVCTLDCIYCQIGKTTSKTIERKEYISVDQVFRQLKEKLDQNIEADYITMSGSGEPTLNSGMGRLIEKIKKITDIPVAVITNGTLFDNPQVRKDCLKADLILPSLDAATQEVFEKINRPPEQMKLNRIVEGLIKFRKEFKGKIWLEVFIVENFNTSSEEIAEIKKTIERINPDRVQLNTAVRPTSEASVKRIKKKKLEEIAKQIDTKCEIIADFSKIKKSQTREKTLDDLLTLLQRRPCSLDDICSGLSIHRNHAVKLIEQLLDSKKITAEKKGSQTFYKSL